MKICLLAPADSYHTEKIVRYLVGRGHNLTICTFHNAGYSGVDVYFLKPQIPILKKLNYYFNINQIKNIIKKIKPDIVHAHYVSSYGIVGYLTGFHPLIISVWGSDIYDRPRNPLIRHFIKKALNKADAILSTSKTMVDEIKKYSIEKSIIVTPFGIDMSEFYPRGEAEGDEFIVGSARILAEHYGLKYLIEAFSIFSKDVPNAKLLIAGKGPQREELLSYARKLKIDKKVELLGFIAHTQMPQFMSNLDIFCIPSLREGFGVVSLEAQACGIPVIASNVGGLPETIDNGKTGFLVPPKDPMMIAEKMLFLYKNPNLRKKMGQAGLRFVRTHYDLSSNIEEIEKVYETIIRNRHCY